MKEYIKQLEFYSEPSKRKKAERYLESYWLNRDEYLSFWKPIEARIFRPEAKLFPDLMFREKFQLIPLEGGVLFTEEEFGLLQKCMLEIGDKNFVVVENPEAEQRRYSIDEGIFIAEPLLRCKYPVDISWEVLMSGEDISYELFDFPAREYFVYGDTGYWGKYAANDEDYPVEIIGFEEQYSEPFKKHFEYLVELEVVLSGLPVAYRDSLAPWIKERFHI